MARRNAGQSQCRGRRESESPVVPRVSENDATSRPTIPKQSKTGLHEGRSYAATLFTWQDTQGSQAEPAASQATHQYGREGNVSDQPASGVAGDE